MFPFDGSVSFWLVSIEDSSLNLIWHVEFVCGANVEKCTFLRIKRSIKSQQTYNQSSWPIILRIVCFSFQLIFVFVPKQSPEQKTPNQISTFKWQPIEYPTCPIKWYALKIISKPTHKITKWKWQDRGAAITKYFFLFQFKWWYHIFRIEILNQIIFSDQTGYKYQHDIKSKSYKNEINNSYKNTNGSVQLNSIKNRNVCIYSQEGFH